MRQYFAALLVVAGLLGAARAEVPVPPLKSRVTDLTGTLNAQQKSELESRIAAFESRRGSQMAVLMLPSTKPEEIEQYSIRVAEAWKIGRRKVDDGLILIVAKDDRRLRIEVGYGLEGAIPDSVAKRVIDERITPRFKAGDFYGGIRDGVDQLIRLAEGEKLPAPQERSSVPAMDDVREILNLNPVYGLMFAFFFIAIAGGIVGAVFGRFAGALTNSVLLGVIGWFFFSVVVAIVAALLGFILSYTNGGPVSGGKGRSSGGWSSGSSSGGSWGGSSSSSSSSSGGFSGGGGSFGGGGASGSW
jgi:uncharacterized protein